MDIGCQFYQFYTDFIFGICNCSFKYPQHSYQIITGKLLFDFYFVILITGNLLFDFYFVYCAILTGSLLQRNLAQFLRTVLSILLLDDFFQGTTVLTAVFHATCSIRCRLYLSECFSDQSAYLSGVYPL